MKTGHKFPRLVTGHNLRASSSCSVRPGPRFTGFKTAGICLSCHERILLSQRFFGKIQEHNRNHTASTSLQRPDDRGGLRLFSLRVQQILIGVCDIEKTIERRRALPALSSSGVSMQVCRISFFPSSCIIRGCLLYLCSMTMPSECNSSNLLAFEPRESLPPVPPLSPSDQITDIISSHRPRPDRESLERASLQGERTFRSFPSATIIIM